MRGISRIDSKNTHGWYVRIYAGGGVFTSKLFSDRQYGSKEEALKNAEVFRDHNQMVAELYKKEHPRVGRKPFFDKPSRNNSSGIVGVNEVETEIRGRGVHYFQATWSVDGKPNTKKFYVTKNRTRGQAKSQAVKFRREREKEMERTWKERKKKERELEKKRR